MSPLDFYRALARATRLEEVEAAIAQFESAHGPAVRWVAVGGRENNRGSIEVSGDPGRAVVERITNGIDAVLETEYERHRGQPDCRSPREAATAWLNVDRKSVV